MNNFTCISSGYQVRQYTVSQDVVPERPVVIAKADPSRWCLIIQCAAVTDAFISCVPSFDGTFGIWLGNMPGKLIQFNVRDHACLPGLEWSGYWSNPHLMYITEVFTLE